MLAGIGRQHVYDCLVYVKPAMPAQRTPLLSTHCMLLKQLVL